MHGRDVAIVIATPDETAAAVVRRLHSDLLRAATTLGLKEARHLVNTYYAMEESRNAAGKQVRALSQSDEPHAVLAWLHRQDATVEKQIFRALDTWSDSIPVARWAKSVGVGPVIAAGLAAHIDMSRCPTVGQIWRFAGFDPTQEWKKGMRCPWNADLKALCLKVGDSIARPGDDGEFYRRLYLQRQAQEAAANHAGRFAGQAQRKLAHFKSTGNANARTSYSQGQLPPAHVQARAKRWVVKLFLSHYHEVALRLSGQAPVKPFGIEVLSGSRYIPPPNF
jgi:hypothetical protein